MTRVDEDHLGPLVELAAWITFCVAIILGVAKVFTKWRIASELYADDAFMVLAIVMSVGTTIGIVYQVDNGLGSHQSTLTAPTVEAFQKAVLATDVFYVLTIFAAKLSLIRFLKGFTRDEATLRRAAVDWLLYVTMVWPIVAVFCLSFRCPLPFVWHLTDERCIDMDALWTFNTVFDCISQALIAVLPILLLHDVKIVWAKKRLAIICYLPIVTTIPFEVLRIVAIWNARAEDDLTYNMFHPSLYTVVHANYSVIASTCTFLIPIVEALSVGLISSRIVLQPQREANHRHVRRGDSMFNPTSLLTGQRFMTSTQITATTTTAAAAAAAASRRKQQRKDWYAMRTIDSSVDTEYQDSLASPSSSRGAMFIETTTTYEVRSGSDATFVEGMTP